MSDLILPGSLKWFHKDMAILARIDRLSVTKRCKVMQLAVVASTGSVKSLRAAIGSIFDRAMECTIDVHMKGESKPAKSPFSAWAQEGGYHALFHKLAYDQVHAVFWSRSTSLLLNNSDQALWVNLKSSRFTTPLIREWLPYVKQKLDAGGFLEPCELQLQLHVADRADQRPRHDCRERDS